MCWFRPRPQPLVLQTVQMRVVLVDPDLPEEPAGMDASPDREELVAEVPSVDAAPPLAVRPIEDADWTFHN